MFFRCVGVFASGLLAVVASFPAPLHAQPSLASPTTIETRRAEQAAQAFRDWARRSGVAQGAIAIAWRGRIVAQAGVGGRRADTPAPVASLSKAVTALCVSRLVDAGRLRYEDRVGQLLGPWFRRHGAPADRRLLGATVSQLLTHRSGMGSGQTLFYPAGMPWGATSSPLDNRIAQAVRAPLIASPGAQFSYSNEGYGLLALIVEQVSGRGYESQCRDSVLAPAGIANAFLGRTAVQQTLSGSGGWWISAADYARLASLLDPASPSFGPPTRAWLETRLRQYPFYGLGFQVEADRYGTPVLSHTGLLFGTEVNASALFILWPDGWSVAINTTPAADAALGSLRRRLASAIGGRMMTADVRASQPRLSRR